MNTPTVSQAVREAAAEIVSLFQSQIDHLRMEGLAVTGVEYDPDNGPLVRILARLTAPDPEIATAVEVEREACAKVAYSQHDATAEGGDLARGYKLACLDIGRIIRARTTPTEEPQS